MLTHAVGRFSVWCIATDEAKLGSFWHSRFEAVLDVNTVTALNL
jgi:hypothetical protein